MPNSLVANYCAVCGTSLTDTDREMYDELIEKFNEGVICAECQMQWTDYCGQEG